MTRVARPSAGIRGDTDEGRLRPTFRRRAVLLLAVVALVLPGTALALHNIRLTTEDGSQLGFWLVYRAGINYDHPSFDRWEAYGDHYGSDPWGGGFDTMTVQVWQHDRVNCGAWTFRHYNEATRYGVTQNWAYAGSEYNPAGNCIKRRAQMVGKFWDAGYYFDRQVIRDE